jgi:hypothetical protein
MMAGLFPSLGDLYAKKFNGIVREHFSLEMSAGVRLDTTFHYPEWSVDTVRYPIIVMTNSFGFSKFECFDAATLFVHRGYVVCTYTGRGFIGSGGEMDLLSDTEVEDTGRVFQAICRKYPTLVDPSNATMMGKSYAGGIALRSAFMRDCPFSTVVVMSPFIRIIDLLTNQTVKSQLATVFGLLATGIRCSPDVREMMETMRSQTHTLKQKMNLLQHVSSTRDTVENQYFRCLSGQCASDCDRHQGRVFFHFNGKDEVLDQKFVFDMALSQYKCGSTTNTGGHAMQVMYNNHAISETLPYGASINIVYERILAWLERNPPEMPCHMIYSEINNGTAWWSPGRYHTRTLYTINHGHIAYVDDTIHTRNTRANYISLNRFLYFSQRFQSYFNPMNGPLFKVARWLPSMGVVIYRCLKPVDIVGFPSLSYTLTVTPTDHQTILPDAHYVVYLLLYNLLGFPRILCHSPMTLIDMDCTDGNYTSQIDRHTMSYCADKMNVGHSLVVGVSTRDLQYQSSTSAYTVELSNIQISY